MACLSATDANKKLFASRQTLMRHKNSKHGALVAKYQCPFCPYLGIRPDDVIRHHVRREHVGRSYGLKPCDLTRVMKEVADRHATREVSEPEGARVPDVMMDKAVSLVRPVTRRVHVEDHNASLHHDRDTSGR